MVLGHHHAALLPMWAEELRLKPQRATKIGDALRVDVGHGKKVWKSENYDATIAEFSEMQLKTTEKLQGWK